ncbi:MAG: low affinity iron permease family protein [Methylococcaceae bacterium]|nr:low affinity iron permease family protein [Methylococcaceae bacterium]
MNRTTIVSVGRHLAGTLKKHLGHVEYSNARFDRFARLFGRLSGRPIAFNLALAVILLWVITGPLFGFSDTWQLVINTATTIVTFLMVFLIQHTQNRDTEAMQVKLDELIRAVEWADDALLDLEELEEEELTLLKQKYVSLARAARDKAKQGKPPRSRKAKPAPPE